MKILFQRYATNTGVIFYAVLTRGKYHLEPFNNNISPSNNSFSYLRVKTLNSIIYISSQDILYQCLNTTLFITSIWYQIWLWGEYTFRATKPQNLKHFETIFLKQQYKYHCSGDLRSLKYLMRKWICNYANEIASFSGKTHIYIKEVSILKTYNFLLLTIANFACRHTDSLFLFDAHHDYQ